MDESSSVRFEARLMVMLTMLFLGRVIGQLLVRNGWGGFLPPLDEWESGILPYRLLLVAQVAILTVLTTVTRQVLRGYGVLVTGQYQVGRVLRIVSVLYFCGMIARYAISMTEHPEGRWFGDAIPIVFHCVLAIWLFLCSRVLMGHDRRQNERVQNGASCLRRRATRLISAKTQRTFTRHRSKRPWMPRSTMRLTR